MPVYRKSGEEPRCVPLAKIITAIAASKGSLTATSAEFQTPGCLETIPVRATATECAMPAKFVIWILDSMNTVGIFLGALESVR